MTDADIRHEARSRLKRKQGFRNYLFSWLGVTLVCVLIWLISGMGYFWPIWPFVGMGIGAIFIGINTYSHSGAITDAQVDAEVAKMKKSN